MRSTLTLLFFAAILSVPLVAQTTTTPPAPAATAAPVHVSEQDMKPYILKRVIPRYPDEAKLARIQGPVHLLILVAKDGYPKNIRLISGHPMLAHAAIDAAQKLQFKPYLVNGEPVEVETEITNTFELRPY